jgi:ribose 5-phosphate isomerase
MIPGVIETGLFSNRIISSIIVGYENGGVTERFFSGEFIS